MAEARTTLSALVDRVNQGEEVVITRRGRPVARLLPTTDESAGQARVHEAIARLRELREELRSRGVQVTPEEIKEWIEEGRM